MSKVVNKSESGERRRSGLRRRRRMIRSIWAGDSITYSEILFLGARCIGSTVNSNMKNNRSP